MASPALQTFIDASAGAAGSLFTCYLLYPLDLAKTQIQSGATRDVRSTLLRILRCDPDPRSHPHTNHALTLTLTFCLSSKVALALTLTWPGTGSAFSHDAAAHPEARPVPHALSTHAPSPHSPSATPCPQPCLPYALS